ncbi:MAG: hypothetical protein ACK4FJ_18530 [Ferrovibrio sp.]|uniref:hypothetical protein n=1 Tax=Ferrovibrio sp. TaxID=1917215 RepID=UPI00391B8441
MTASQDKLAALHDALASHFADVLKNGEEELTKEGEVVRVKPKAATLNAIRQFLKDNGIEAKPGDGNGLGHLVAQLPQFEDDDLHPN